MIITRYSSEELPLLRELREYTTLAYKSSMSRMISGPMQGTLLTMLARATKASNILELGTFTGYATLAFAYGLLDEDSDDVDVKPKRRVYTCDIDNNAASIARRFFSKSDVGHKVSIILM
jgi:hypothetical protein